MQNNSDNEYFSFKAAEYASLPYSPERTKWLESFVLPEISRWEKGANQNNPIANYFLARIYEDGVGVLRNYEIAHRHFLVAANQGYANAQLSLGGMYYCALGVESDITETAKWYRLAAEQGHVLAQHNLAQIINPAYKYLHI